PQLSFRNKIRKKTSRFQMPEWVSRHTVGYNDTDASQRMQSGHQQYVNPDLMLRLPSKPSGKRVRAFVDKKMTRLPLMGIAILVIKTVVFYPDPVVPDRYRTKHFKPLRNNDVARLR